jgi:hypothetical protein
MRPVFRGGLEARPGVGEKNGGGGYFRIYLTTSPVFPDFTARN